VVFFIAIGRADAVPPTATETADGLSIEEPETVEA
jgi:hypothetical protein